MRTPDRAAPRRLRTCVRLLAGLAITFALAGCAPGDNSWLACLFGDRAACDALTNPPPPPPPPVEGAPAAPTGLSAAIVAGGVSLDWDDNSESDVTRYTVYRGTYDFGHAGGVDYTPIGLPSRSDFLDEFLHLDSTTYFYAVTARDSEGLESPRSTAVMLVYCAPGHTCAAAPGPPAAPTGLVPVLQDASGLTLDWNDNTEPDLDRYLVYRTTTPGSYGPALFYVNRSESRATISAATYGLAPFTTYYFTVTALDSDGDGLESPRSNEVRVRFCPSTLPDCPAPPGAATGLQLVSRDAAGVSLDWDDTPGANVARYAVYRGIGPLPAKLIGTTAGSSFTDHEPDADFENHYTVAAIDADGHQGAASATLDVRWCGPANPTCAAGPAQPTGLTATPQPFRVFLDWADNHEPDLAGYRVELSFTGPAGPFSTVNGTLATASEFTIFDLSPTVTGYFRVLAVDTAGRASPPSAVVSATSCPAICSLSGTRALHTLALRRVLSAFKLTLSADLTKEGARTLDGGALVGTGDEVAGTFDLRAAPDGLDRPLKRLAAKGLRGTWRAAVDWRLDPSARTGTSTAVALASFDDPALGRACLRLTESYATTTIGRQPPKLVTHGVLTLLGGTSSAPALFADGTYTVKLRRDGALVYKGTTDRSRTVPPGLPADCAGLGSP